MMSKLFVVVLSIAAPVAANGGWEFDVEFGNFSVPHDVAVDSHGDVYVLDGGNRRVQVFTADGEYLREITGFLTPRGVAIDENDVVYVLEGCRVHRFTPTFDPLGSWDSCIGQGDLQTGRGIDVKNGVVYVATANNLLEFSTDGAYLDQFPLGWTGVRVSADDTIWVVSVDTYVVRHYSADGDVLAEWSTLLPGEGTSTATRIDVDSNERIFVNDQGGRVKIFRSDGVLDDLVNVGLRIAIAVELDGDTVLYVGTASPDRVMRFHYQPLAVSPATWGSIKSQFR